MGVCVSNYANYYWSIKRETYVQKNKAIRTEEYAKHIQGQSIAGEKI